MNYSSKLIADAVNEFNRLPGIGEKTALRLVLHLLKQRKEDVTVFSQTIAKMRSEIKFCKVCHNVSDHETCNICENQFRDQSRICIVENLRDIIAIENTNSYKGTYHVLGGLISPIDGVGPDSLNISTLLQRIINGSIAEVIMALSPTIEGDTTAFYLSKKIKEYPVQLTLIARGVSFGGEMEYTDELTLGKALATRLPYEKATT